MKKEYMKPSVEVEVYTLSASIAHNCQNIVTVGPQDLLTGRPACDEFKDLWEITGQFGNVVSPMGGNSFYEGSNGAACDCYYTAGGQGYFTS